MTHALSCLPLLLLSSLLNACGGANGVPNTSVAAPVSLPGSPPTPAPADWKGLFDSDSQSYNVAPNAATSAESLRAEPDCTRVDTVALGAFTSSGNDERASLLTCGATHRVVISDEHAKLASLDVTEDTIITAGDMAHDGRTELLLIGHAAPRVSVRVLRAGGGKLSSVYDFSAMLEPCTHIIIYYRLLPTGLDFRVDKLPKRCSP